jgi:hypothetical protein
MPAARHPPRLGARDHPGARSGSCWAPTVRPGSTGNAAYLEFIATSSEKVAYFRAFALKGHACLMIERPGA